MSEKKYERCGCVEHLDHTFDDTFLCEECGWRNDKTECEKAQGENSYYIYKEIKG